MVYKKNYRMSCIRSKNTLIEKKLRKLLWSSGHRYRIHYSLLPGKPDIVFVKERLAIFCDSEFWHGYNWSNRKKRCLKIIRNIG